jgi:bifunctional enzyme CysN/CysC
LGGDNVAQPSANTTWYEGNSLLHLLETVYIGSDQNLKDFRFPVQLVNRPDRTFRGFSGTVASGTARVGDEIVVMPSGKSSRIKSIETMTGQLEEASTKQSVTLTLEDEIDITRGDVIVRKDNVPNVSRKADAMVVWMSETKLQPGRKYWFKQLGQKTSAEVSSVRYGVDINTLHRTANVSLGLNEIGRCEIETHDPVVFDPYRQNRQTGSFILVDRISHETVAAGMFVDAGADNRQADNWDSQTLADYSAQPVNSLVTSFERKSSYAQKPMTILISGLSASGKTTLAKQIEKSLFELGGTTVLLDGQTMRAGLSRDLGFSAEERSENLRRAAEVAKLLNDSGIICVASFIAPHDEVRQKAKELIGAERFFHIHLSTPIEVCRQRDESGIYAAADRGEISGIAGVDRQYETPTEADITISHKQSSSSLNDIVNTIILRVFEP